jgi:hypothetical protein
VWSPIESDRRIEQLAEDGVHFGRFPDLHPLLSMMLMILMMLIMMVVLVLVRVMTHDGDLGWMLNPSTCYLTIGEKTFFRAKLVA